MNRAVAGTRLRNQKKSNTNSKADGKRLKAKPAKRTYKVQGTKSKPKRIIAIRACAAPSYCTLFQDIMTSLAATTLQS